MRIILFAILFLAGVMAISTLALAAPASPPLPLDSWVYPVLDKLEGLGLVDSSLQGSRPYTRLEAARLTREARNCATTDPELVVVEELLGRLEVELSRELAELEPGEGAASGGYFRPLRGLDVAYVYQQGEPAAFPGINARQFSLNYNNFGIDYDEHHNGQVILEGDSRLGEFFLMNWRPLLLVAEEDVSARLLDGTAALALGPVEFSVGRQSLWWGQGRHGSLLLTNNARPLDMVRLTNPTPARLPWLFKYLGPFRFDVFWSRLESERVVPEPYLAGLRLNFKPFPILELGAARTVMFGGKGRPDVDWKDFFTILTGHNLSGGDDTSNQLAALDFSLKLPFLWGAQLYGEWGGEDEANGFISKEAYVGGVYLPKLESSGRLSLRLEYADLTRRENHSPVWYRHSIYQSGYTYRQHILGHHVGSAAKDYFTQVEWLARDDLTLLLSFDYERRGTGQPVSENHVQPALEMQWRPAPWAGFRARYAFDKVENFGFLSGNDRTFHLAEFGLTSTW